MIVDSVTSYMCFTVDVLLSGIGNGIKDRELSDGRQCSTFRSILLLLTGGLSWKFVEQPFRNQIKLPSISERCLLICA